MPRKQKTKYVGYVRYTVDEAVKAAVKKCTLSQAKLIEHFVALTQDGYKFSIEYDSGQDTYNVSLYGSQADCENVGVGLAARHAEMLKAMRLLYVLHFELYQEGWPQQPKEAPDQYTW